MVPEAKESDQTFQSGLYSEAPFSEKVEITSTKSLSPEKTLGGWHPDGLRDLVGPGCIE